MGGKLNPPGRNWIVSRCARARPRSPTLRAQHRFHFCCRPSAEPGSRRKIDADNSRELVKDVRARSLVFARAKARPPPFSFVPPNPERRGLSTAPDGLECSKHCQFIANTGRVCLFKFSGRENTVNSNQSNVSYTRKKNVKFTGPWAKSVCFSERRKGEVVLGGIQNTPGRNGLVSRRRARASSQTRARAWFLLSSRAKCQLRDEQRLSNQLVREVRARGLGPRAQKPTHHPFRFFPPTRSGGVTRRRQMEWYVLNIASLCQHRKCLFIY